MSEVAHQTGAFLSNCSVKRLVRRYHISMKGMLEHGKNSIPCQHYDRRTHCGEEKKRKSRFKFLD